MDEVDLGEPSEGCILLCVLCWEGTRGGMKYVCQGGIWRQTGVLRRRARVINQRRLALWGDPRGGRKGEAGCRAAVNCARTPANPRPARGGPALHPCTPDWKSTPMSPPSHPSHPSHHPRAPSLARTSCCASHRTDPRPLRHPRSRPGPRPRAICHISTEAIVWLPWSHRTHIPKTERPSPAVQPF